MIWEITLPFPPSVNHYKKVGRLIKTAAGKLYQQRVNTDETKTFYFQVYVKTKNRMPPEWDKFASSDEIKFQVSVYLYPPNGCRYDIDNRLKVLLDGLVRAHVIKDDSQIYKLYVEKMHVVPDGQVIVRIQELKG